MAEADTKSCNKCGQTRPVWDFYAHSGRPGRTQGYCKDCFKAKMAKYRADNPEKARETWRRSSYKRFGITLEDYNRMFAEQNGECAICRTHQASFKQALAVDHCHATGVVRGLLCEACNHAIGKFKDSVETLESAINYLLRFEPENGEKANESVG